MSEEKQVTVDSVLLEAKEKFRKRYDFFRTIESDDPLYQVAKDYDFEDFLYILMSEMEVLLRMYTEQINHSNETARYYNFAMSSLFADQVAEARKIEQEKKQEEEKKSKLILVN